MGGGCGEIKFSASIYTIWLAVPPLFFFLNKTVFLHYFDAVDAWHENWFNEKTEKCIKS